jgi:hypothetical protein
MAKLSWRWIGDEATVKRFYRTNGITLKAENPKYEPIQVERSEAASFNTLKSNGRAHVMKNDRNSN